MGCSAQYRDFESNGSVNMDSLAKGTVSEKLKIPQFTPVKVRSGRPYFTKTCHNIFSSCKTSV